MPERDASNFGRNLRLRDYQARISGAPDADRVTVGGAIPHTSLKVALRNILHLVEATALGIESVTKGRKSGRIERYQQPTGIWHVRCCKYL